MNRLVYLFLLTTFFPGIVQADANDPILLLPEGQAILSISATERQEVAQDLLVASLTFQATGSDVSTVQNEVNATMQKALEQASSVKELKVQTGAYGVYEFTEPRTKEKKWRASQSLTLKSVDAEQILKTTAKLQELRLSVSGLSYMVSPEKAVQVKDQLMEGALETLQRRANRAAAALGKKRALLKEISVESESGGFSPPPVAARSYMLAEADMAQPVAAAGESTIALTVNARALLLP